MTQTYLDPDPYAELEYRADAFELSEEFRKPIRVQLNARRGPPTSRGTSLGGNRQHHRV